MKIVRNRDVPARYADTAERTIDGLREMLLASERVTCRGEYDTRYEMDIRVATAERGQARMVISHRSVACGGLESLLPV